MKSKLQLFLVFLILFSINITTHAQTWQNLGTLYSINNVADLSIGYSGTTRTLYLASNNDVMMVSLGSQINFTKLSLQIPSIVACDNNNPSTVYSGVGPPSTIPGMNKSTDGGATWTRINSGLSNPNVTSVAVSSRNGSKLLVGCKQPTDENQIPSPVFFQSTDGGASWAPFGNFPVDGFDITKVLFDPSRLEIFSFPRSRHLSGQRLVERGNGKTIVTIERFSFVHSILEQREQRVITQRHLFLSDPGRNIYRYEENDLNEVK